MDYENVKAIVLAMQKQWSEAAMNAHVTQESPTFKVTISNDVHAVSLIARFCDELLLQLRTSFDIWEAQR